MSNKFINNIILGDCYEVLKDIPSKSIDLIVIDPPYEISKASKSIKSDLDLQMNKLYKELETAHAVHGVNDSLLDELFRVMKKPNIYIWCNKKQILQYLKYFVEYRKCSFDILVWIKTNPVPLYGKNYMNDKEFCLYFRKGISLSTTYESGKTYWITSTNKTDKAMYNHPTCKPEEIISKLISNSSNEGDIVLDCFLGSGTTVACAKKLNRRYIGIEVDKEFYLTAINRISSI